MPNAFRISIYKLCSCNVGVTIHDLLEYSVEFLDPKGGNNSRGHENPYNRDIFAVLGQRLDILSLATQKAPQLQG